MEAPNSDDVVLECPGVTVSIVIDSDLESEDDDCGNEMVFQVICEGDDQYKLIKTEVESNKSTNDDGMEIEIKMDIGEGVEIKEEPVEFITPATVIKKTENISNAEIKQETFEMEIIDIKEEPLEAESIEVKEEPLELGHVSSGSSCDVADKPKEYMNTTDCADTLLVKAEFTEQASAESNNNINKIKYKKCPHCAEKFSDKTLRKQHIRNHKLEIFNVSEIVAADGGVQHLKCRSCAKTWPRFRKIAMQKHALKHRPKIKSFAYYDGVWAPAREYTKYACPECNQTFASQSKWNEHIRSSHRFFDPKVLNNEMSTTHNGQQHCRECGTQVPATVAQMQRHKLLHMPHKSFICKICGERKHWFVNISQHIRKEHFTRGQYECIVCKKILETYHLCWQHCCSVHKLNISNLITKNPAKQSQRKRHYVNRNRVVVESTVTANNFNSTADDESQPPTVMKRIALRRQARSQGVNELKQTTRVINTRKVKRKQLVWNWNDDAGAALEQTLSCTNISKELENMYKQRDIVI